MSRRLRDLSADERHLVIEASLALAVAFAAVAVMPFRHVMSFVRPPADDLASEADERPQVQAIRWAIGVCARRVPWRALCLEQALAAQWMLGRRGIRSTLFYGARRGDEGLLAHAWVRTSRYEVVGCENSADFGLLATFPTSE